MCFERYWVTSNEAAQGTRQTLTLAFSELRRLPYDFRDALCCCEQLPVFIQKL